MSTLQDAIENGDLQKFEAKSDPDQLEERSCYMTIDAMSWCFSSRELGYPTPNPDSWDMVHAALTDFVVGQTFLLGPDIRRLRPETDDIWEIKTSPPDAVRVFGWFYSPNVFICSHCEYRSNLNRYVDYEPHIRRVKQLMSQLGFQREDGYDWNRSAKQYFDI